MPRVVASIEARMGSSRLPGKVLMDIEGEPVLTRLLQRLQRTQAIDDIVLATSTSKADDTLVEWAKTHQVAVFRGSEEDVLSRVVGAHEMMRSDVIVEITGDCPLLDPDTIDLSIATFLANECDVVTNARVPSFPQGADTQVFTFDALASVEKNCQDPAVREHVSLYFYENPRLYRIIHLLAPRVLRDEHLRLQLDYPEDLTFIRALYSRLLPLYGNTFTLVNILELLHKEPHLRSINAHCEEKPVR